MPREMKDCPACSGTGKCQTCDETGTYKEDLLDKLRITSGVTCKRCSGTGNCKRCNGKGVVPQ